MSDNPSLLDRREAIKRVSALLGGIAFVGGSSLLTACERRAPGADTTAATFTADEVAFLDEIAETILPQTKTPGAKAAQTGAFMALMVRDSYSPDDQKIFRDGLRSIDDETRKAHNVTFMAATPAQRLSVLERLDRAQRAHSIARENAQRAKQGLAPVAAPEAKEAEAHLASPRDEGAPGADAGAATVITADTPAHYFRMMKELALLGYFTSEIGCTQAQRYAETPGRYDPCVPYKAGDKAWAPHA
jgi:glucoside 3-dehydrogenase (cytochrome c) hitch-hiker subunit